MSELKKTPLHESHRVLGGKLVDFHGWEMPVQYDGLIKEHLRTREGVSLFDVSHMGEVMMEGKDALANIQKLTTNDASSLAIGQVQLSTMLYPNGTIVDDLTVYRLDDERYQLCINSANTDKDFDWIKSNIRGELICENTSSEVGQIAIQGKYADAIVQQLTRYRLKEINYYWCAELELMELPVIIARMGYTGEDGFEIFCRKNDTKKIWNKLLSLGKPFSIAPAGLGARDTLRLEMGYSLYGNDIDDQHNVLESGLGWLVKLDSSDFIGKEVILKEKEKGISQKLVPFILNEKGVPRQGYKIFDETGTTEIGIVTSGTSSPSLKKGIGMGYIKKGYFSKGEKIRIQIRKNFISATITKTPFIVVKK